MRRIQHFLTKYKKEVIAAFVFVVSLCIFSISYAFAVVEPVGSIVITSQNTNFASGEEGSWQVTKSGYWTNYGKAEISMSVKSNMIEESNSSDVLFVLGTPESMEQEELLILKNETKEIIDQILQEKNNRVGIINFNSNANILTDFVNDKTQIDNCIDTITPAGKSDYYQAYISIDKLLQTYQKTDNRNLVVVFIVNEYPNVNMSSYKAEYRYLKSQYPYMIMNMIQYSMSDYSLDYSKEISDNQWVANTEKEVLESILYQASRVPILYEKYQVIDYIENTFILENTNDVKVSQGKVELSSEENGQQKIIWTLDNFASGSNASLTMKLKLKEEFQNQEETYVTNEGTEITSKIDNVEENVSTTTSPILADSYQVIYDGNAPEECTVSNVPESAHYSVFSTAKISDKIPSCSGYEFKGWHISTEKVTRVGKDYFIMPESEVIIKAEWSKLEVTKAMNGRIYEEPDPIMKSYTSSSDTDYHSSTYKSKITSIIIKDEIDIPTTAIEFWDVSAAGNGSVMAYIEENGNDTYKVTIAGNGGVIANPDSSYLFYNFESLTDIDLSYLDTTQVTNMAYMFAFCIALQKLDLNNFQTNNVVTMRNMFTFCMSLSNLELNFDTSNVTDMQYIFSMCSTLTEINFGEQWNTSNVTNMAGMFNGCGNLSNINLSKFNTLKVINMESMFSNCSNLLNLDLRNFNTSNVTDMSYMFQSCRSLSSLNITTFNTSKVTKMTYIFSFCTSLTQINFGNQWNTSQVTDMSAMFQSCTGLTTIDLSTFDTSNVTNMNRMFCFCSSLTTLNLTMFETSQVIDMGYMFTSCSKLTSLNLSSFKTDKVTNMSIMFSGCDNLTNLDMRNAIFNATSYSSMFSSSTNSINVIVKNASAKSWIESRLWESGRAGTVTIASA